MGVRLVGGGLLRLGHLGPQALELLVERALVGEQRRELLVLRAQARFQRLQLLGGLLGERRGPGQRGRIEGEPRRRAAGARVGAREPVGNVEQLAQGRQRIRLRHGAVAVHRAVAERVDHPGLAEHRLARGLLEARLVDQCREVVLIGQPERRVVLVGPAHRQLQRAPGVEARRARIGMNGRLGSRRGVEHRGPFTLEEGELAHVALLRPQGRESQLRVIACHSSLSQFVTASRDVAGRAISRADRRGSGPWAHRMPRPRESAPCRAGGGDPAAASAG